HLLDVIPFARMGRSQSPSPWQPQPHMPHHGDPSLRCLGVRWMLLVSFAAEALGFLFAVLRSLAMAIVGRTKRPFVGNRSRRGGARAVETDQYPLAAAKKPSAHLLGQILTTLTQPLHPEVAVAVQGVHEGCVIHGGLLPTQCFTDLPAVLKRIGDVPCLLPGPDQGLGRKLVWVPLRVAVKLIL